MHAFFAWRRTTERAPRPRFLAIFDFDCTLTSFHVWGRFKNAPLDKIPVDETMFIDMDAFRSFVQAVRRRNADVAVATFGRRDVVDKALKFALGDAHGVVISTPADHFDPRFEFADDDDRPRCAEGSDILGDKNTQIDNLCQRFGLNLNDVLLLDDDIRNVSAARARGIRAEHTPKGANRDVLDRILPQIAAPP